MLQTPAYGCKHLLMQLWDAFPQLRLEHQQEDSPLPVEGLFMDQTGLRPKQGALVVEEGAPLDCAQAARMFGTDL